MKRQMKVLAGITSLALVVGITFSLFGTNGYAIGNYNMMGSTGSENYSNTMMNGFGNNMMGGFNNGMMGNHSSMMGGFGSSQLQDYEKDQLIPLETLTEKVEAYIANYNEKLDIEDVFIFSNSEYYYSIIETETGKGAMELLVNPISGYIYPEHGPNMMWNEKYGMHGSNGMGMMNMMGGSFWNGNNKTGDDISKETALEKANQYLSKLDDGFEAEDGGHAFYGYYTFHVNSDDETIGMLSVNASTGDVWYHNWHGTLLEVESKDH